MTSSKNQRHCLVLVVDDAPAMRDMLKAALELHGYRVELACNGLEALQAMTQIRFDAVLTDMWMPEMTGARFIETVRADSVTAALPIYLMSGESDHSILDVVPATAFFRKPFELQPLLTALDRLPC